MDYKEKYEQALEVAKETYNKQPMYREWLGKMFPELAESEDEMVRQKILFLFYAWRNNEQVNIPNKKEVEKTIAWLEKQGKQKNENICLDCINRKGCINCEDGNMKETLEQKLADKVEPKFHEGQWVTNGDYTWKIVEVKPLDYILQSQDGNIVDDTISHVDEQFHSFTIKDAKDGDVLVDVHGNIGIFEQCDDFDWVSYCSLGHNGGFQHFKIEHENENTYPATKEQRDLLFSKIKEAGYEWDAINLKLNRISQRMVSAEAKEAMYDKPKWNVSDFRTWQYIVSDVLTKKDGIGQYLDSGECKKIAKYMQEEWSKKLNIEQKPAWSDEDERLCQCLIEDQEEALDAVRNDKYGHSEIISDLKEMYHERIDWLKSLKQRIGG